jgi:prepilin-type N-terminal cleavage/methylation domain-containing protein
MKRRNQGFTLVEMSIVLVIVGVILAAVMIGRDTQKNAEYLRIRQAFVNQWLVSYNAFFLRYGFPMGDQIDAPRLMVNGSHYTGPLGGDLTSVVEPPALCGPTAPTGSSMARAITPAIDPSGVNVHLLEVLANAGIEVPKGRGRGLEDRYAYLDANGNPQELQVCFQWNRPGHPDGVGNIMTVTGLTPDLARSLDSAIDGVVNASDGTFRLQGVALGVADWGANSAQAFGGAAGDRNSQVNTVTAYYRLNQ